ncbi:hypothetical protein [Microvirga mediterraneensis]|uniref:Uncharacterized protein n=1 Tax=Microvirga mediterraneensis TaxID=2754695 RepID=A0A838BLT0_9HYPH|nr:hypothetical protein [Microvirga mediterraneensis]MBA1156410.1 hypothetical protein [Microvirga mediterraneensis]
MSGRRTGQVLLMLAGLIAWAVQFTIIYAVTSTLCGREWADATILGVGSVHAVVLLTTIAALCVAALSLLQSRRVHGRLGETAAAPDRFMSQAGSLISGLSLVVILWQGIPAFILPACA